MKKTFLKPCLFICLGLVITTIVFASTVTHKPSPPRFPKIEKITTNSCTISYQAPADDGGSRIISYRIESFDNSTFYWTSKGVSKKLTHTAKNMKPGTRAIFRIIAQNSEGESDPVETTEVEFPH